MSGLESGSVSAEPWLTLLEGLVVERHECDRFLESVLYTSFGQLELGLLGQG